MISFRYILCAVIVLHLCLSEVSSSREDECMEVGFARSSFMTVNQGYEEAKEELLKIWEEEDKNKIPTYRNLSPQIKNITRAALLLEVTSKKIVGIIRKTRVGKRCAEELLLKGIERHVTPLMQLDKELAEGLGLVMSFRCMVGSPYPNVDGTCVNEEGPDIGSNGAKFLRLLPPVSSKGGFGLRGSVNNEKVLPSARQVALLIRRHLKSLPTTTLFTEMSHFIAQDTVSIPDSPLAEDVDCCTTDHVDCMPVHVDKDDPIFPDIKCFNLKRSIPAQAILGHRESLSAVSTYLDATPLYGSTNEAAFKIKEGYFGYVKYPQSIDDNEGEKKLKKDCSFPKSFKGCFGIEKDKSDFIENLRLLLVLEHNTIADSLSEINPHFDDSLLYNEARRILIAQYNAILYGEFVPLLVGEELAKKHSLLPGSEGPGAKFIHEVNPGILTSHAFGSSRNPAMINEWKSEWGKSDILTPLHFESVKKDSYQDLLAIDIQKGRDHGLPGYNSWRKFCDPGKPLDTWDDLETIFTKEVVADIRTLYQDEVRDVDVLVALLEDAEEGALVGKVFTCILVDQFARLKTGNRLYWEHDSAMLTHEQRDVIRSQSSAASLLCRHLGLARVPKNPFLQVSESNPEVDCSEFSKLDLKDWKDTSLIEIMKKKEEEEMKEKEKKVMEEKKRMDEERKKKEKEEKKEKKKEEKEKKGEKETKEEKEKKEENVETKQKINTKPKEKVEL